MVEVYDKCTSSNIVIPRGKGVRNVVINNQVCDFAVVSKLNAIRNSSKFSVWPVWISSLAFCRHLYFKFSSNLINVVSCYRADCVSSIDFIESHCEECIAYTQIVSDISSCLSAFVFDFAITNGSVCYDKVRINLEN